MHPVLAAALANPRMPRPYGADHGDNLFGQAYDHYLATDYYMRRGWRALGSNRNPHGSEAEHIAAGYVKPETLH